MMWRIIRISKFASSICIILHIRFTSSSAHLIIANISYHLFFLQHAPFDGIVEINSVYSACMYLYGNGGKWKVMTFPDAVEWLGCFNFVFYLVYGRFDYESFLVDVLFANFWSRFAYVSGHFPNCFRLISGWKFGSSHEKFDAWPGP